MCPPNDGSPQAPQESAGDGCMHYPGDGSAPIPRDPLGALFAYEFQDCQGDLVLVDENGVSCRMKSGPILKHSTVIKARFEAEPSKAIHLDNTFREVASFLEYVRRSEQGEVIEGADIGCCHTVVILYAFARDYQCEQFKAFMLPMVDYMAKEAPLHLFGSAMSKLDVDIAKMALAQTTEATIDNMDHLAFALKLHPAWRAPFLRAVYQACKGKSADKAQPDEPKGFGAVLAASFNPPGP